MKKILLTVSVSALTAFAAPSAQAIITKLPEPPKFEPSEPVCGSTFCEMHSDSLGAFLHLLMEQLRNQDPTDPMTDVAVVFSPR